MSTTSTPTGAPPRSLREPVIGPFVAAGIGIIAVLAALGIGHLVAGFVSPVSSPYLAVGDLVIRFSPEPLTEFAKVTFGTADKPILLGGMLVVILLVAAAAGVASRRRPTPGATVVVVLGMLGLGAVVFAPTFSPADLVAPLASLAAGVGAFRGLHALALQEAASNVKRPNVKGSSGRAPSGTGSKDARPYGKRANGKRRNGRRPNGPAPAGVSRRTMLAGASAAVGIGAVAAAGGGQLLAQGAQSGRDAVTARLRAATITERAPAVPAGAAFPQLGTPTFITDNADFYRIDTALRIPTPDATSWRLNLHGMLDHPISLSLDDLLGRTLVERTITMTCVSNPIGGNLISNTNFIGVELRDILLEAGVSPQADAMYSTSADGWYTSTPTSVLLEPGRGALLAIGMNGEALPPEHGFPVRMVVPGLYGYVSATKWLVDLEATTLANPDKQGYWYQRGWAQQGPIKTETRIDGPQPFAHVPVGTVSVAGIAWAQHTGISYVEVRADEGPWQRAILSDEVTVDTWRMWRTTFPLAAGSHSVEVRATDKTGRTQTEQRADPIPDGASGWPSVIFTVG